MTERGPNNQRSVHSRRSASRRRVEHLVSAGGVVYRADDGRVEVVLCGRWQPVRWSLPKGTPDEGETIEQTALREVQEETGLEVVIQEPIDQIEYWFQSANAEVLFHKRVYFFLMVPRSVNMEQHDPEFDEVRWLPIEKGVSMLTYPTEVRVLEKARKMVEEQGYHGQE